jgi:hypothetical protein
MHEGGRDIILADDRFYGGMGLIGIEGLAKRKDFPTLIGDRPFQFGNLINLTLPARSLAFGSRHRLLA